MSLIQDETPFNKVSISIEGLGRSGSFLSFGSEWQWLTCVEVALTLRREPPSQACHDCGRGLRVLHCFESFVLLKIFYFKIIS